MSKQVSREKSFLSSSLRLDGITAILECLINGELTFTQLFINSNIKFKTSFLKYAHYCKDKQFITSKPGISKDANRGQGRAVVWYSITDKGRAFLEMIE